jgi:hypothetical protein
MASRSLCGRSLTRKQCGKRFLGTKYSAQCVDERLYEIEKKAMAVVLLLLQDDHQRQQVALGTSIIRTPIYSMKIEHFR